MATRLPAALAPLSPAQIQVAGNLFKLASDETRLKILSFLSDGEMNVTTICEKLGMSQPAISHHLCLARLGGLIEFRREGKRNLYRLLPNGEKVMELAARLGEAE